MSNITNLRDEVLLVGFSCGRWYAKATDKDFSDKLAREASANPEFIKSTKDLMKGIEEYAQIPRAEWAARAAHRFMSVPWGETARAIKATEFQKYMDVMNVQKDRFWGAVDFFLPVYPSLIQRAELAQTLGGPLGKLFKASDYPDPRTIREKFRFDIQVSGLTDGSDFRTKVSDSVVETIQECAISTLAANLGEAMGEVYDRIHETVVNLAYILENPQRSFKDVTISNIRELVKTLPGLNIINDPKIIEFQDKLEKEVLCFSPSVLRDGGSERVAAAQAAREIERRIREYSVV